MYTFLNFLCLHFYISLHRNYIINQNKFIKKILKEKLVNKMGKTFGALALVFGLVALLAGWAVMIFLPFGDYILYALCGLAIVFGIIGIIKDDSKGMGIAGLILGIIAIFLWVILWVIIFVVIFAGLFGGLL